MLHATPQFTPQQLLDAGRRAEGEGRLDLAGQFYRHLTENYGYTAEAAEARNGLGRVGITGQPEPLWQTNAAPQALPTARPTARGRRGRGTAVSRRDSYRTGRLLAALFSAIGWLVIAGASTILAIGAGTHLLHVPPLLEFSPSVPLLLQMPAAMLAGAFAVLCGQAVRALFDQANAARELVALERARNGPNA
jgi:hypothetical protein